MKKFKLCPLVLVICLIFTMAAPAAYALDPPVLDAQSAALFDVETGNALYELNMNAERAPASLTKVMTVLLALEAIDKGDCSLEEIITAGGTAWPRTAAAPAYCRGSS